MLGPRLKSRLDILIGTLIFVSAATLSAAGYAQLLEIEKPEKVVLRSIPEGKTTYHMLHRNSCVGILDLEASHETLFAVNAHGKLHILLPQGLRVFSIQLQSSFNPLGQMIGSMAKTTSPDYELALSTENINPLLLRVSAKSASQRYHREFSLPGPVILSRDSDRSFRIDYFYLQSLGNAQNVQLLESLRRLIDLRLVPAQDSPVPCSAQKLSSLDLTRLVQNVRVIIEGLRAVVPFSGRPPAT